MVAVTLENTFGAFLIGAVVSACLFGATSLQMWYYFQHYNDAPSIKLTVVFVWVLEFLHSAFAIHAIYYFLILSYGNPLALAFSTWSANMTIGLSGLITLIVHLFLAQRVYHLAGKRYLPLVLFIVVLAILHIGFTWTIVGYAFKLKAFAAFETITRYVKTSLALAVVTDGVIAISLCYFLYRSRNGSKRSDTLINKLMIYAINNGILTSLVDIIVVIFVTVESNNLIYLAIFQVVGNLYANTLLATLNSRKLLAEAHAESGHNMSTIDSVFDYGRPTALSLATNTVTVTPMINTTIDASDNGSSK